MVRVRVSIRYNEETSTWRAFAPGIKGMEVSGTSLPEVLKEIHLMLDEHFTLLEDEAQREASKPSRVVIDLPAGVEKEAA